ncbi:hypothetical protein PR048_006815 [Dryococelus australis]|uniref:Uncharacterized protein n=1 Tax=Dryococelus australis TaxID=614101 RepID=A0ABQ9IDC1_9NEOP|nr:hypothetical protein PR048_006815 [Dryococelus australis]
MKAGFRNYAHTVTKRSRGSGKLCVLQGSKPSERGYVAVNLNTAHVLPLQLVRGKTSEAPFRYCDVTSPLLSYPRGCAAKEMFKGTLTCILREQTSRKNIPTGGKLHNIRAAEVPLNHGNFVRSCTCLTKLPGTIHKSALHVWDIEAAAWLEQFCTSEGEKRGSARGVRDMRVSSLIAPTRKAMNWRAVLPDGNESQYCVDNSLNLAVHGHGTFTRSRNRSVRALRVTLTRMPSSSLPVCARRAVFPSVRCTVQIRQPMRVKRDKYGKIPECKGGGNGISPRKPADQRHLSARFPHTSVNSVGVFIQGDRPKAVLVTAYSSEEPAAKHEKVVAIYRNKTCAPSNLNMQLCARYFSFVIVSRTCVVTKPEYINRTRLERSSQKQFSDAHKTPYGRVKRCRERKINIKSSERVNVDVFTQNKQPVPNTARPNFFFAKSFPHMLDFNTVTAILYVCDSLAFTEDAYELKSSNRGIGSVLTCFGVELLWNLLASNSWP